MRCLAHSKAADRARGTAGAGNTSKGHQVFRRAVLQRDPVCVACSTAFATVADHSPRSLSDLEQLHLNPGGPAHGRGLRHTCHSRETARHQSGSGTSGRGAVENTPQHSVKGWGYTPDEPVDQYRRGREKEPGGFKHSVLGFDAFHLGKLLTLRLLPTLRILERSIQSKPTGNDKISKIRRMVNDHASSSKRICPSSPGYSGIPNYRTALPASVLTPPRIRQHKRRAHGLLTRRHVTTSGEGES